jgi:SulP family sulfate permease
VVVSVAGDLFFGVSHLLREELKRIVEQQQPRVLILRTRRVLSIDYSCWQALLEFAEAFHRRGGSLYLCGVSQDMYQVVAKISLREVIPSDHIFLRTDSIFGALYAALGVAVPRLPADAVLSPRWAMELRRSPPPATP